MKNSLVETLVGAAVIVLAAGFFTFAYTTGDVGKGTGGYTVIAEFENAAGISTGSDVRMSGVKVGIVLAQDLDPASYQAVLKLSVDPKVKLPADSTAKITSEGILGGNFVALEVGGSETMIKDGGKIENTQGSIDLFGLIGQFINKD